MRKPGYKMSFHPSSELSTTDGRRTEFPTQTVPDEWCCNSKTSSAEQSSCSGNEHITMPNWTKTGVTRDVRHWDTDVLEVCRTCATDRIKGSKCHLEQYSLWHLWPVEDVMHGRCDVVVLASTNKQAGSGIQHDLQSTSDLWGNAVEDDVTEVNCAWSGFIVSLRSPWILKKKFQALESPWIWMYHILKLLHIKILKKAFL